MSTPYWGQLPGPKVAQQGHSRRMSESEGYGYSNADRRHSLDVPHTRKNRTSIQTTVTDAPTESTFSPVDSPSAVSFAAQGLAPRPPSYQRGASDSHDRKTRRQSRHQDEFEDDPSSLPAAPEVPRGPPVSYRHPYGNGGLPFTHTASGGAQPQSPLTTENEMDVDYYNRAAAARAENQDYGRVPPEGGRRESSAGARDTFGPPLRASTGTSDRRRKFANDRSPLQRLELTLDSITKEEKRARVEAAEQRARERAAIKAGKAPEQQVRFSDRRSSGGHAKERITPAAAAAAVAPAAKHGLLPEAELPADDSHQVPRDATREIHRDEPRQAPREVARETRELSRDVPRHDTREVRREAPEERPREAPRNTHREPPLEKHREALMAALPQRNPSNRQRGDFVQHAPEEIDHYGSGAIQDPDDSETEQNLAQVSDIPGIPKRNLSFRERAARDNVQFSNAPPEQIPSSQQSPPTLSGGFSLTRSGSNKLRKDPPSDIWHSRTTDTQRRPPAPSQRPQARLQDPPADIPRTSRDKDLPKVPPGSRVPTLDVSTRAVHVPMPGDSQGIRRRATDPIPRQEYGSDEEYIPPIARGQTVRQPGEKRHEPPQDAAFARRRIERADSDYSSDSSHHHRVSNMVFKRKEDMVPGDGLYKPPKWLDEWKKGTVGTLGGNLLDVHHEHRQPTTDQSKAWWEKGGGDAGGNHPYGARPRKAEAFDGEYDEKAPTRFKPPLYMKCGPLLRYCGIRKEKVTPRASRGGTISERELWRGSVMIVTQDSDSSYEIAPTLRLFVQEIELLPPPPHKVKGDLSPEYVDPIAGHPKVGRRGETLYVRPVDHLEEAKDLSRIETDNGLFEQMRSPPDVSPSDGEADLPGSFASRRKRIGIDGEKVQKYKDVRGFRLHAERGYTFWRFNIEVELRDKQQRIAYRINRGPATGFWVPARGRTMNMMFYSCNGFSMSVKPDELSGPDPLWRDVLNNHQTQPFHLMIGGGDQIYNDCAADQCALFGEWLDIRNPVHKHTAALTPDMQDEMEMFYLERYCMWFSQGLFGLANSQIPMVNMYDDHDIFDGYGSYPHHYMNSPVFCGLGAVAFKYYMLFQHQTNLEETDKTEPSWILGDQPGPYINELSHSLYMMVGARTALLAVDARTERTEHDVVSDKTWEKIMNRLYAEVQRGQVEHLLVLLGVPIAYPRLVWLENILTSRLMDPVKALGRAGMLGKVMNNIDGGVEVLDDLNDHWTAKNHKQERSIVIEDLQDLAIDKSLRVTILSGDVHLAAVGQFYSNPKLGLAKHKDPRYMPNVISSAIVNTPPPDMMADVLNKRNKVHHFDKETDEDMIPMFPQGVDGKKRNNKHLLPHRNWCSIREWAPGNTPPPTPPGSSHGRSPSPPPPSGGAGGLLRRLSLSRSRTQEQQPTLSRDSVRGPRPPVTRVGGLFRSLSRRGSTSGEKPAQLPARSMSVGHGEPKKKGGFFSFGRRNSQSRPDDGGINGNWGYESDDDDYWLDPHSPSRQRASGIRGGAAYDEYSEGDESYFTAQPTRRAQTMPQSMHSPQIGEPEGPPTRPFHRTPTGLSTKQMKKVDQFEVDLEGGLDICINVEVNPKDPTGITVPYRLLVPKLFYEYDPSRDDATSVAASAAPAPAPPAEPSGFKRLLSFRKKPAQQKPRVEEYDDYDSEEEYERYQRR